MKTGNFAVAVRASHEVVSLREAGRKALTIGAFAGVASLTVWSAILAKEATYAPPLADVRLVNEITNAPVKGTEFTSASTVESTIVEGGPENRTLIGEDSLAADEFASDAQIRWFNGRPVKPMRTIEMTVTAYSPDAHSCDDSADGLTATMHHVSTNAYRLVAADPRVLGYGSMLSIPGYDSEQIVPVLDCGGAIKGRKLDVLFPTHAEAKKFGVQKVKVTVWGYADGKPADDPRKMR